jgi:hypothetical protein
MGVFSRKRPPSLFCRLDLDGEGDTLYFRHADGRSRRKQQERTHMARDDLHKMLTPTCLEDYVRLTKYLCELEANDSKFFPPIDIRINGVLRRLSECPLPLTRSNSKALRDCRERLRKHAKGDSVDDINELKNIAHAILESLLEETGKKQIVVLAKTSISSRLRRLARLTLIQRHLVTETVRCMETGSYRAAVVMGWSLAYDRVRYWAWENAKRRASFNRSLKTHTTRAGSPVYPKGIRKYEDFFTIKPALSEWSVLETMKDAGLISGVVHDRLCHYLRERNNFAHPNFRKPSQHKASAYIEDLLDLIADPPFQ